MECSAPTFEVSCVCHAGERLAMADDNDGVYLVNTVSWEYTYVTMPGSVYKIVRVTERLFACVLYSGEVWLLGTDGALIKDIAQGFVVRDVCVTWNMLVLHVPDKDISVVTTLMGRRMTVKGPRSSRSFSVGKDVLVAREGRMAYKLSGVIVTMPYRGDIVCVSSCGMAVSCEGEVFYVYQTSPVFKETMRCRAPKVDEVAVCARWLVLSRGKRLRVFDLLREENAPADVTVSGLVQCMIFIKEGLVVGQCDGFSILKIT